MRANGAVVAIEKIGNSRIGLTSAGTLIALVGSPPIVGIDAAGSLTALLKT